jgi:outer membrane protein assembly factor BamB
VVYRQPVETFPLVFAAFNGHVFGMHRDTGERVWTAEVGGGDVVRLAASAECVYALAKYPNQLWCLEALTGRRIWSVPTKGETLLVHEDRVFVGGAGELWCHAAHGGAPLWRDGFKGMGDGEVAIAVPGLASQADRSG